jgi:hypothetical protein
MTAPWHLYSSVTLDASPEDVRGRLVADPAGSVTAATAAAISSVAPLVRAWGLTPSALPTVTADVPGLEDLGAVELRWSGDEHRTGWPSLRAELMVTPADDGRARLAFVSDRDPRTDLGTIAVGRAHRQRVVAVAARATLEALGRELGGPDTSAAPGARAFDRTGYFVHHLRSLDGDAASHRRDLVSEGDELAAVATAEALERAAGDLEAGRFRTPAEPRVTARPARPDELGSLRIGWEVDQEATGWPRQELALDVELVADGPRLVVLADREPAYDLSVNRVDKRHRHAVAAAVGGYVGEAVARRLEAGRVAEQVTDTRSMTVRTS